MSLYNYQIIENIVLEFVEAVESAPGLYINPVVLLLEHRCEQLNGIRVEMKLKLVFAIRQPAEIDTIVQLDCTVESSFTTGPFIIKLDRRRRQQLVTITTSCLVDRYLAPRVLNLLQEHLVLAEVGFLRKKIFVILCIGVDLDVADVRRRFDYCLEL